MNTAVETIARRIIASIDSVDSQTPVLLLLPGGSEARYFVDLFHALRPYQLRLTISLTDERYGPVGHGDSNWHAIDECRPLLPGAQFYPVLTGVSVDETTRQFAEFLDGSLRRGIVIGLFGVGIDGHISGIKPSSPACSSREYASSYEANDFIRITTTPALLRKLSLGIVAASGEDKAAIITQLQQGGTNPLWLPAEYIKQANDYEIVYESEEL